MNNLQRLSRSFMAPRSVYIGKQYVDAVLIPVFIVLKSQDKTKSFMNSKVLKVADEKCN